MKNSLLTYTEHENLSDIITYEMWCGLLDSVETNTLSEGIRDTLAAAGDKIKQAVLRIFGPIKDEILKLAEEMKIGLRDIVNALKERSVFGVLKAVGFKIKLLVKAILAFTRIWREGLAGIFREISKNKLVQKLQSGAMKVDEFLDKYPILKKIGGIAVAGLLLYIWLNMSFIGDLEYDMNVGDMTAALAGNFSIAQLFLSPAGLMMITLFATGGLISAPWLGASTLNLVLALIYTGYVKIREKSPQIQNMMRKYIQTR